jgi:shikimate 5-dehydrogenase
MDVNVAHTDTELMVRAKALGCRLVYGREMFERQALGQFSRWSLKSHNINNLQLL